MARLSVNVVGSGTRTYGENVPWDRPIQCSPQRKQSLHPEAKRRYAGEMLEVPVGTQQDKLIPDAKLSEKRIDRTDL